MADVLLCLERGWTGDRAQVRGTAFLGDRMLSGPALSDHIGGLAGRDAVLSFLRQANGFFSVVCWDGRRGWMAVDRVRGFPLFYGHKDGSLFVSDDAYRVLHWSGEQTMDPVTKDELLALGYVTGGDTLFGGVKQIQSGEVVFLELDGRGHIALAPEDYYIYRHEPPFEGDEGELAEAMDRALESSFRRLTEYAAGRPVVVPLSGGYDSCLTVIMLKRMGYPDIRTYTYGVPEKGEVPSSRFMAETLGVPWHFVPYTPGEWHEWYRSPTMGEYMRYASGLSVKPVIQDFPAVWHLARRGLLPEGSVFAPGHTPVRCYEMDSVCTALDGGMGGEDAFFHMLQSRYYGLGPVETSVCRERSAPFVEHFRPGTREGYVSLADTWAWRERQSKLLVGWNQMYEFFGFDWWLPFWDREFLRCSSAMPVPLRLGRNFYERFVRGLFAGVSGCPAGEVPLNVAYMAHLNRERKGYIFYMRKLLPLRVQAFLKRVYDVRAHTGHSLALEGLFTGRELDELYASGERILHSAGISFLKRVQEEVQAYRVCPSKAPTWRREGTSGALRE